MNLKILTTALFTLALLSGCAGEKKNLSLKVV